MIKITGATARIREQHDWCARTAKYAFQRRITNFDGSILLHSHLPHLLAFRGQASAYVEPVVTTETTIERLAMRLGMPQQMLAQQLVEGLRSLLRKENPLCP
jgi:hypothetical protein